MAEKTIVHCDRCGCEITDHSKRSQFKVIYGTHPIHGAYSPSVYDFCNDCISSYEDWFNMDSQVDEC